MRKFLIILGGACAAYAVLFVILVSIAAYTGPKLDKESKAYADAAVLAIASEWNDKDLTSRASPRLMASLKGPDDLARVMSGWRMLGPLKKYEGSNGEAHIFLSLSLRKTVTAVYSSRAEFDHDSAVIQISIVKSNGAWKILGFRVLPDPLPSPQAAKPAN